MSMQPSQLYNAALPELEALMREWGQPAFRARQLYRQLYVNLADDVGAMSDLPRALRQRLTDEAQISSLHLQRLQLGDQGQTRKALFALHDGAVVETVLMIYHDRATVCVSTQAGCAMGCTFCATARMGLLRNLSTGEIVEQVMWAARELKTSSSSGGERRTELSNIVFMGMGEPFANYDRWWGAVERLHDPHGFNFGARRMTVSTVGLVTGIRRLAQAALPINLAISLHAPDDAMRSELMPVNQRYPIADLLDATRDYITQTSRRVSFEYVLMQGRNDTPAQARMLADLLRGTSKHDPLRLCHVNLIPWNPVPGEPFSRSERQRVLTFQQALQERGVACTVRVERGVDIAAACGQLAGKQSS